MKLQNPANPQTTRSISQRRRLSRDTPAKDGHEAKPPSKSSTSARISALNACPSLSSYKKKGGQSSHSAIRRLVNDVRLVFHMANKHKGEASKKTATKAIMPNHLYYGDNLEVLREHIRDESIDLIYLDPPFNSQANYNVLYREPTGQQSKAQIEAFVDTWHWNDSAEQAFDEVMQQRHTDAAELMRAVRAVLQRKRPHGLSHHDGRAACRTASGVEANRHASICTATQQRATISKSLWTRSSADQKLSATKSRGNACSPVRATITVNLRQNCRDVLFVR